MSTRLKTRITGFITGDDLSVRRTIDRDGAGDPQFTLPNGVTITKAWLTVKAKVTDSDANALVQKEVTVTNVPGTGQIENDGTGDVDPVVRFDLTPADTIAIGTKVRPFDVQVKTSGGKIYTADYGTMLSSGQQVTEDSA